MTDAQKKAADDGAKTTDSQALLARIQSGELDAALRGLYFQDEASLARQRERYAKAIRRYEQAYGQGGVQLYSAPGRTEIGGNHTDHQNGMVLAASIDLDSIAVVGDAPGNAIHILSEGYPPIALDLGDLSCRPEEKDTTAALIRGVAAGFQERGYRIGPFQAYITSDVLGGAGLSSSASFEILIGAILSHKHNDGRISPIELAIIAQYAENAYFGKPCGLMDQMACSVGGLVHIDFIDPEKPAVRKVDYDVESSGYRLCIVDTKGSHADLTPDYAAIPAEMGAVAAYFGKKLLTQVSEQEFCRQLPDIRAAVGDRAVLRAIHFYKENQRVQQEADALAAGDFEEFLAVFRASARSSFQYLQNVYSSRDPGNQAIPIALCLSENALDGRGACRVHGGGFAGTIQAFVPADAVPQYKEAIERVMGTGACHVLKIRGCGGIRLA